MSVCCFSISNLCFINTTAACLNLDKYSGRATKCKVDKYFHIIIKFCNLTTHGNPRSKSRRDGEPWIIKIRQTELNTRLVYIWTGGFDDPVGPVLVYSVAGFLHRTLWVRRALGSYDYIATFVINQRSSLEDVVTIWKKSLKNESEDEHSMGPVFNLRATPFPNKLFHCQIWGRNQSLRAEWQWHPILYKIYSK